MQRRHQKVVEIAPAPNLDENIRQALYRDAVEFAKALNYVNAGTVEFLVDTEGERAGQHVFIEMNPRIQVEHTVTEEITDVDLVQAQMRIASGETLADLGLSPGDGVHLKGAALQCRITTEDPANGFRPDVGKITGYRSAGGAGVRLDGGTVYSGAEISPHFDSMLVKLTCRGRDYPAAVARARRGLAEFRIRGVSTNIPFLQAVLADPDFIAGNVATDFIDKRPELLKSHISADRGTKLLTWLAEVTVNKPNGELKVHSDPASKLPAIDGPVPASGSRQRLLELGPEGFAKALREQNAVAVTDTTFRDAHQSLLATRVRTRDLVAAGPAVYCPACRNCSPWRPGAVQRTTSPSASSARTPGTVWLLCARRCRTPACRCCSAAATPWVTRPYPEEVTEAFVNEAAATGIDIFRIFDALNDVNQMAPAIRAVRATGTAVAEVALCYTGNLLDPNEDLYTLDYYLDLAQKIVDAGAHILAIKDMAGLLRPAAAAKLVTALRERFDLPVHLHTHDTAGGQLATLLAAVDAGVDAVDVASASLAGTTSQPAASALVAALANTPRDTGPQPGQRRRAGALLGSRAPRLRTLRIRPAGPHRTRLPARNPRRPAVQPSPAGHGPGPRRAFRGHRGHVHGGGPHPGPARSRSRRPPRWWATSRCTWWDSTPIPRTSTRTRRTTTSRTPSSASSPANSVILPEAGPSRSAPRPFRAAASRCATSSSAPRTAPR